MRRGIPELFRLPGSPSSRRAWIEIIWCLLCRLMVKKSPSSRRAWIEIFFHGAGVRHPASVALLAEGVDRNFV